MFKNQKLTKSIYTAIIFAGLMACSKSENAEPAQPYDNGVMVLNQGNFLSNNGTISFMAKDSKVVAYDIFQKENTRTLAGGVTDYVETANKGIILVDNSTAGKDNIEIVDAHTFKSLATIISDIENPRHVIAVSATKVYITCWDTFNADYSYKPGYVAVVDLVTNKVIKKIPVQAGAEDLVLIGGGVFVGNIYTGKKILTVIDPATDNVKTTFEVGVEPKSFVVDANNKLWLTTGKEIIRVNPINKIVEARFQVGTSSLKSPDFLTINNDKTTIFFTYYYTDYADKNKTKGEIYSFKISDTSIPANKPLITKAFTGLGYDATNDIIYGGYTTSYEQAGFVYRFHSNGSLIDSVKAEISPIRFYVK